MITSIFANRLQYQGRLDDSDSARLDVRGVKQKGVALLMAMLILIMLSILGIAMFRGFGLSQKIAGNSREKQRAFEAAENALQFAEWWLGPNNPTPPVQFTGGPCTGPITITTPADMRICSIPLLNPIDPINWAGGSNYKPPAMIVAAGGGTSSDGNGNADINYSAAPKLYIAYLGLSPTGKEKLYSVTAGGFGGGNSTVAVVQSVVAVSLCGGGAATSIDGTSAC